MAKLSDAQVKALQAIRDDKVHQINARTLSALRGMFAIKQVAGGQTARLAPSFRLTPTGRTLLDEHERAVRIRGDEAQRLSRPVPASAFMEPSARTAPVMPVEYEDDSDLDESVEIPADHRTPEEKRDADRPFMESGPSATLREHGPVRHTNNPCTVEPVTTSGPSVRLTPAPADAKQEATDGEILQLLTMLDHGVKVTRALYQAFTVRRASGFTLNPIRLDRAARDAVRFGLARQVFADRVYRLIPEPVHLLTTPGAAMPETACKRYAGPNEIRLRHTTDPSKVTHERCKGVAPFKVDEVVRFRHNGTQTGRLFRVVETDEVDGDLVRVAWDNPPEDYAEEIIARWVGVSMVERVPSE